ncbi:hypothetical protein BB561_003932 [Smittium simulii]|uniref:NEDD8-activating enzyme E1 catalytic subunit n=1 Tax=Smittium simulii TaxID=133385 RepID=A0A2T9YIW8_9FUNG|nr:hypothetical protein BB561_003932 [Smittium simulii]
MEVFYTTKSAFDPDFAPDKNIKDQVAKTRVLVIGAGGLGCEILKNLVMNGFRAIDVIDMDTIELSNLNRQFLFRDVDIGKAKAITAAAFVNSRVGEVCVTPIQDKDKQFYRQFNLVICGLDSIEARRWVSGMFIDLVDDQDPTTMIPIIDGGTEGFRGQSRIILPSLSACHECSSGMHSSKKTYPICTISNTPRLPEHCIEYASVILWPKEFGEQKVDTDNIADINWILENAVNYSKKFGISGIDFSLVLGVLKNIVPAIASTNAIIAASCVNEAIKLVSGCNPFLDNYMLYVGDTGLYSHTFTLEKNPDCFVCGNAKASIEIPKSTKLEEFIEIIKDRFQLKKPSLRTDKNIYMQAPPTLELKCRPNLEKALFELFESGNSVTVTDSTLTTSILLTVDFAQVRSQTNP